MKTRSSSEGTVLRKRQNHRRAMLPVVLIALVLWLAAATGSLWAAAAGEAAGSTEEIRGKTTLAEIEKEYRVPATFLIERLKLPADTSLNEPLKAIKDRHGFEMEAVRALVQEYRSGKAVAKGYPVPAHGTTVAAKGEAAAAETGKGVPPAEKAEAPGRGAAGTKTEPQGHGSPTASTATLILGLYGLVCVIMLLLLRKNKVSQGVRLAVLTVSLLVFGVLFKSQIEPVRAISQVFQALGMGRYGVQETLLVFLAFTAMILVGVKLVCGWGCPVGALQEMLYHLPGFAKIKKMRTPFWLSNGLRIVLFIAFLIFVFGWIPGFRDQSIYRYFNPFKLFEWNFRVTAPIIIAVIFALSIVHYRFYCLWICPFGLFSWLIQNASIFQVRVDHGTCIDCGKCVRVCPTDAAKGIYEGKTIKVDCFSCARCLKACPNGSLQYRAWSDEKTKSEQG